MIHHILLMTGMSIKKLQARDYQENLDQSIVTSWSAGNRNVLAVLPTAGGKTFLFTGVLAREENFTCAIAHRQELVSQMSLALNKRGVSHFAIAPKNFTKWLVSLHMQEHGQSFYNPNARCAVAGVDTLMARADKMAAWCNRVSLWVIDEGHHVIRTNKWGKAVELFPNARGLLVTATPERGDGKGLGRHASGVVDAMVMGPTPRDLINRGFLTDYRIFAPAQSVDLTGIEIGASGEFKNSQLIPRVRKEKAKIIGDVVSHYLKHAAGKLGITFATDVETATDIAGAYRAAGVPAEVVSAKTQERVRIESVRRLQRGELRQLVNVDIFGEGFDLPAVEVVSFARPTASYVLFCQQFGRGLRPSPGKTHAIIIDHVGNVMRHGLPDARRVWSLDNREKRAGTKTAGAIPLRACPACTGVYEAFHKCCPYCAHVSIPLARSKPEFVDGDLAELDQETLAAMRGEISRIDMAPAQLRDQMLRAGAPEAVARGAAKQHRLRQEAQTVLRESMALWGGMQKALGRDQSEGWKRFYWRFGVDVLTAQTLGRPEAERLNEQVREDLKQ
jgi:superfamily II DNA or RNA helicase